MCTKDCFICSDGPRERITIQDADMTATFHVVCKNILQRSTNKNIHVTSVLHHATSYSYTTSKVDFTCIEQPTEEDNSCWLNRPDGLSLVDR